MINLSLSDCDVQKYLYLYQYLNFICICTVNNYLLSGQQHQCSFDCFFFQKSVRLSHQLFLFCIQQITSADWLRKSRLLGHHWQWSIATSSSTFTLGLNEYYYCTKNFCIPCYKILIQFGCVKGLSEKKQKQTYSKTMFKSS